ncbi:ACR3 family arsenite efflux transporter [Methanothermobacter marburgensis]|uniref:Predicted arsenical-resistance protein n=1 Tax=Methanothermobacter marburgensis (strain ATCC BAA-927 / DSM 2133 / JCM 14651 / NBRC 100331 / OCM 82 / Marburg) TaxID=79929 RepID=D9PVV6_METTM|nr:ACR3 family arsenite efflux transporter [Methanothermobacter marburgensis]ADL58354.1 predicted arsenical-resistance protein [Methanothermobacter marburgensis str. Marburg]WBF10503.1 ACR3 family arsenite efflux transporter [Methanothermobacter marburgensis]
MESEEMGIFERYLTVWVILCIITGVGIGQFIPAFPALLNRLQYAQVSLPVAVLIWLMIYPMMLRIDFSSIIRATREIKGLAVTCGTNWLIKPFTMYIVASFFLLGVFSNLIPPELGREYLAGAVLLGAAPCTAMVFVWSSLTRGDPAYTLVQVAVNDIILLFAYAPIVAFLLGIGNIQVPYDTLILSVVLFVVVPLLAGYFTRRRLITSRGPEYFQEFLGKFENITVMGLLLTLIIIFSFQGRVIIENPLHICLIAVPLIIQTFLIFTVAYLWARIWRLRHAVAAPAALIGASNFFELAVAVAISLFGLQSGAALATVVGVLVEVPVMLTLVRIANATRDRFPA